MEFIRNDKKTLKKSIKQFFKFKFWRIRDLYWNIRDGIKNTVKYLPLIWNTRDWDSTYLFEMMKYKISKIRETIDKNKIHEGYEKDVENMKLTEEALERIIKDEYHTKEYDEYMESLKCWFEPCKEKKHEGMFEWKSKSKFTEKQSTKIHKDQRKYETDMKNKDFDLVFKMLREESCKWWD